MWGFTRHRASVTRAASVPEYDRSLVATLVATKPPRLAFGRTAIASHMGFGAVMGTIVGSSSEDLEWLEAATTALGGEVVYMPIRRGDGRITEHEVAAGLADGMVDVAHAIDQGKEADAILAGDRTTGQPDTDRELRRIVGEGRSIRGRALDRDAQLVERYVTDHSVDAALIGERAADRRRYDELRDEYQLMNGGVPATWPF